MKKEIVPELNYFNAFACLLVVMIHVLSVGISNLESTSWQYAVIYFPWQAAAFVVPAFLFIGAVKVGLSYTGGRDTSYGRYVLGRFQKVYLPYFIWYCVYFAVYLLLSYTQPSLGIFLTKLLNGKLSSHFYYIVLVMQFYLLRPLWHWVMKKLPVWGAVPAAAFITLLSLNANHIFSLFGISFIYQDRIFTSYLLFWIIGLYAGKNYEAFAIRLRENKLVPIICAAAVPVYLALTYFQSARGVNIMALTPLKVVVDIMSIILLLWLCIVLREKGSEFLKRTLSVLHQASLTIYLSHMLLIVLLEHFMSAAGITDIALRIIIRAAFCFSVPFLLWKSLTLVKEKLLQRK